jgi:hypothetical protein
MKTEKKSQVDGGHTKKSQVYRNTEKITSHLDLEK